MSRRLCAAPAIPARCSPRALFQSQHSHVSHVYLPAVRYFYLLCVAGADGQRVVPSPKKMSEDEEYNSADDKMPRQNSSDEGTDEDGDISDAATLETSRFNPLRSKLGKVMPRFRDSGNGDGGPVALDDAYNTHSSTFWNFFNGEFCSLFVYTFRPLD